MSPQCVLIFFFKLLCCHVTCPLSCLWPCFLVHQYIWFWIDRQMGIHGARMFDFIVILMIGHEIKKKKKNLLKRTICNGIMALCIGISHSLDFHSKLQLLSGHSLSNLEEFLDICNFRLFLQFPQYTSYVHGEH